MPWVIMSVRIAAELFVADGVFAPVHMASFYIIRENERHYFCESLVQATQGKKYGFCSLFVLFKLS
jgi:hypothetical protein